MAGNQKILNSTAIGSLSSYENKGGFLTSAGRIVGPDTYKGILLNTTMSLVGGYNKSTSIRVTASDGYALMYTFTQLSGNVTTYDPKTANEVKHNQTFVPMLAYYINGGNLSSSEGPLRLVFVGPEALIVDGHLSIKFVSKIEVLPAVMEYTLKLNGTLKENMDRATFESGATCHGKNWTDADGQVWRGVPLWLLVGRVDDSVQHEGLAFNRSLAEIGYDVMIIAADGYSVTLNASTIKFNDNIILANWINRQPLSEKYWPLRLVGNGISSGQMIRNVNEIRIIYKG
ncbi:MAG: iron complex transport system substrate-binding protein, partial [Thermoproteota archaeon]|nr:iron complex transport system substrate-binding protein [Thermoproteota archaeon]